MLTSTHGVVSRTRSGTRVVNRSGGSGRVASREMNGVKTGRSSGSGSGTSFVSDTPTPLRGLHLVECGASFSGVGTVSVVTN